MEIFYELLLSLITILFALLIAKIAPAAAELGRHQEKAGDRAVRLEELGRRRSEPSKNVDVDAGVGSSGVEKEEVGEGLVKRSNEVRSNEFNLGMEKSKIVDVIVEGVQESDGCLKIEKVDVEEEVEDLVMDESVKKLEETVEFEEREEGETQLIDIYRDEFVKELESCEEAKKLPEMGVVDEERFERGEMEGSFLIGEDEWEGIEKSEVEKRFEMAVEFVGSEYGGNVLSKLNSDVQKQLYGLHKVATEGPCYEPQPLALKVTARAKW